MYIRTSLLFKLLMTVILAILCALYQFVESVNGFNQVPNHGPCLFKMTELENNIKYIKLVMVFTGGGFIQMYNILLLSLSEFMYMY